MPWRTFSFVAFLVGAAVALYQKKPVEACVLIGVACYIGPG